MPPLSPEAPARTLLSNLEKQLTSVRAYEASFEHVAAVDLGKGGLGAVIAKGALYVALPNRMHLKAKLDTGVYGMTIEAVLNGKRGMVRTLSNVLEALPGKHGLADETVVFDQRVLSSPETPFDRAVTLVGLGIATGQDLVGTIRDLLEKFGSGAVDKKTRRWNGRSCTTLERVSDPERWIDAMIAAGRLPVGQLLHHLKKGELSKARLFAEKFLAPLFSMERVQELFLCDEPLRLAGWRFGRGSPMGTTTMILPRFKVISQPDNSRFEITPQAIQDARDITEATLEARKTADSDSKVRSDDPKTMAALRVLLLKALKKPIKLIRHCAELAKGCKPQQRACRQTAKAGDEDACRQLRLRRGNSNLEASAH